MNPKDKGYIWLVPFYKKKGINSSLYSVVEINGENQKNL